ncbi:peptidoglycan-binding protein [Bacillota bacterium Meth-B3]
MFCSHCGKTLDPAADNCPHCGVPLGESRMSGHTSVQPRYLPQKSEGEPRRYAPYTKTSYMGEGDAGEDVYSRTAYRPVLAVDNAQPAEEDEDEDGRDEPASEGAAQAAPEDGDNVQPFPGLKLAQGQPDAHQLESLGKLTAVPEDAPPTEEAQRILARELDLRVQPPKPIRKAGISPAVAGYIERMEALKNKGRKKRDEDDTEETAEVATSGDGAELLEKLNRDKDRALRPTSPVRKWVMRGMAVAAIVVLIASGLIYLAQSTQPRSPIEGVSKDLYDTGLTLIKTRATLEYRAGIINLFKSDPTAAQAQSRLAADLEEVRALKSAAPMEHDGEFIEALASIQNAVGTAVATDALAALATDSQTQAEQKAASAEQWGVIDNAIRRIESAVALEDLRAAESGVKAVEATPEPAQQQPAETPAPYQRLKRKDKGPAVKKLQQRLSELGWYGAVIDGVYGSNTMIAVKRFQPAVGMEGDGIASPEMQEKLFSDDAPRFTPGAQVVGAPDSVTKPANPDGASETAAPQADEGQPK